MYCMIGVLMDHWSEYAAATHALKARIAVTSEILGIGHPSVFEVATGMLLIADWDGRRILAGKRLPKPLGFALSGDRRLLYVATWGGDELLVLAGNEVIGHIRHPWFNAPHTVEVTPRGLLVTSSGTDFIAEVDREGRPLWEMLLFEHGYDERPFRLHESFDKSRCYGGMYIPSAFTVHVNSAILIDEHTVLATLFGPGELVRIDRRTGTIDVVLSGLRRPHAIRRRSGGGYLLSNTEGGEIILLNEELRVVGSISVPAPWIQDALVHEGRVFAVGNRRIVERRNGTQAPPGARATNRVLELDMNGIVRRSLDMGPDHRLYMVEIMTEEDAHAWADAWKSNAIETHWMRWDSLADSALAWVGAGI